MHLLTSIITAPGTFSSNVDVASLPQHPIGEDSPPPIPPQHFSADDILQLPNMLENREPQESQRDAPPPCPPRTNQEDAAPPPLPPKTHQCPAVSAC